MDANRKFRMGLVGCGRISQTYVQAIEQCPNVRLAAVMDTRPEPAAATAERSGAKAFEDLESFVRGAKVEGAIVCAPPAFHRPTACALLEAGVHVLCEKPFATCMEDALAMQRVARQSGRMLMMASKFRYVDDVIRAKAMIASGVIGQAQFYRNQFNGKVDMRGRWNSDPAIAGGGVIIDNGTHSVDLVRYLVGPIVKAHARESKRLMGLPVEDTACVSF
ncbi:MAG: Gfo/Idh/MocA family oxidoreductase, partial [Candidatus Sumerlaeota bacterium]|nr:Gfo/Idh/MocA family oxidoreductase [Candidatus Sumerlaeota bacterium]